MTLSAASPFDPYQTIVHLPWVTHAVALVLSHTYFHVNLQLFSLDLAWCTYQQQCSNKAHAIHDTSAVDQRMLSSVSWAPQLLDMERSGDDDIDNWAGRYATDVIRSWQLRGSVARGCSCALG